MQKSLGKCKIQNFCQPHPPTYTPASWQTFVSLAKFFDPKLYRRSKLLCIVVCKLVSPKKKVARFLYPATSKSSARVSFLTIYRIFDMLGGGEEAGEGWLFTFFVFIWRATSQSRAGHLRYFLNFSIIKNDFFPFFIKL